MAILGTGRQSNYIFFNWPEVAVALLKLRGIHTGWWKVGVKFANTQGVNARLPTSKTEYLMLPASILPIECVSLLEVTEAEVDALCVNAAVVNPRERLIVPATMAVN